MRVLIFGATGMVGQGFLRECLLAKDVEHVLAVGRTATGLHQSKLRELVIADLHNVAAYESQLRGFDACFYCLGVSSAGMTEAAYTALTYELTFAIASRLALLNPAMTFVYVSGQGTDSSERGRIMWARIKGRLENALLRMPFQACMFRPGIIVPLPGIRSKTRAYRILYTAMKPLLPLLHRAFPNHVLTTEELGQTMLTAARNGATKTILETKDLRALLSSAN